MNTRLQVEHPITELTTGLDLVREQIRIARGEPLGYAQEDVTRRGHAIECRVYAEDPTRGFLPSPGRIETLSVPSGPGVRDDSSAFAGAVVSGFYDPLVSKLSVWAPDRGQAVRRMHRALGEYVVTGLTTNLPFHLRLMEHPEFAAGRYDTGFIERHKEALLGAPPADADAALALSIGAAVAPAARDGETRNGAAAPRADREPSAWRRRVFPSRFPE
jgi:acetyl-CoA carboxylase biotin carboxylase subunit